MVGSGLWLCAERVVVANSKNSRGTIDWSMLVHRMLLSLHSKPPTRNSAMRILSALAARGSAHTRPGRNLKQINMHPAGFHARTPHPRLSSVEVSPVFTTD
jgi:hypothetical protein